MKFLKKTKLETKSFLNAFIDKPDRIPDWATQDFIDPIKGYSNVIEPPEAIKTRGWDSGRHANRQFFNWLGRYTALWIRYFDRYSTETVANPSGLPMPASQYEGKIFYIKSTKKLCYSDGTTYQQFDTTPVGGI